MLELAPNIPLSDEEIEREFDLSRTEHKIAVAARECFDRTGVRKTRIEDIADQADLSRQTVYKYFSKKQDIVDLIGRIEMLRVNRLVRAEMSRHGDVPTKITEGLYYCAQIARQNKYLRNTLEDLNQMPGYMNRDSTPYVWQRDQWSRLLREGQESGELADDLDFDLMVHWLILTQFSLLVAIEKMPFGDIDLRSYIRRFFVEPLVRRVDASAGDSQGQSADLVAENRHLRDIVAQQALELHLRG